jgi:hypothetical protein
MKGSSHAFCSECGTYLYFQADGHDGVTVLIGTIDALYMFGEGREEGDGVPEGGFGKALCACFGGNEWCKNEIRGVTDEIPMLLRGKRSDGNVD